METDQSERIRKLNDALRTTLQGGRLLITAGVNALSDEVKAEVLERVRTFEAFDEDNDPHKEHDFGEFDVAGEKFFFKIDYYAPDMAHGSENPADPERTTRVLTIMLAEEY